MLLRPGAVPDRRSASHSLPPSELRSRRVRTVDTAILMVTAPDARLGDARAPAGRRQGDRRLPHHQRRRDRHRGDRSWSPSAPFARCRPDRHGEVAPDRRRARLLRRRHAAVRVGTRAATRPASRLADTVFCSASSSPPPPASGSAGPARAAAPPWQRPQPSLARAARGRDRHHAGRHHAARALSTTRRSPRWCWAPIAVALAIARLLAAGHGAATPQPLVARLRRPALPRGPHRHADRRSATDWRSTSTSAPVLEHEDRLPLAERRRSRCCSSTSTTSSASTTHSATRWVTPCSSRWPPRRRDRRPARLPHRRRRVRGGGRRRRARPPHSAR